MSLDGGSIAKRRSNSVRKKRVGYAPPPNTNNSKPYATYVGRVPWSSRVSSQNLAAMSGFMCNDLPWPNNALHFCDNGQ